MRLRGKGRWDSPHRRGVDTRHTRDVVVVHKFGEVAVLDAVLHARVLVLVFEVLDGFGETHGGEAVGCEGAVVAAPQVPLPFVSYTI